MQKAIVLNCTTKGYTTGRNTGTYRPDQPRKLHEYVQMRCSWRWLTAGASLGLLSTLAIRQWGSPAMSASIAIGVTSALYATLIEPRRPVVERVTLHLPHLTPALCGLRIGHLSDFHLGWPYTSANVRWAVEQMKREQPDIIVFTGDFVSYRHAIHDLPGLLHGLHAPLGIYAVTGNHDMWEGAEAITTSLAPLGIEFLLNINKRLHWHGADFWIAGIDDVWYGMPDVDAALANIPTDAFTLFLSHVPDVIDQNHHRHIDLQLSGHTHGGQVWFPWLGALCLPFYGLRYPLGLIQVGSQWLYVSRGLGGLPVRMNCSPEVTILTLR